jgi:3-oxoacyl-[acyl-carrier protein] reductase
MASAGPIAEPSRIVKTARGRLAIRPFVCEHPPMLSGKVAVVTGGARGIGLATARAILDKGGAVAPWDLDRTEALEALEMEFGDRVAFREVDIGDYAATRRAAADCGRRLGRIDVLVNNAGVTRGFVALADTTDDVLTGILDPNLAGAIHCARAVLPYLQRQGSGRIVNCSSILARHPVPGQTAYAASKSAVEGLTRVWARELGPSGVTVNAVAPGYIQTRMNADHSEELESWVRGRTALGRLGEPEEVAAAVAFLASDAAAFITGVVLPVDGGYVP